MLKIVLILAVLAQAGTAPNPAVTRAFRKLDSKGFAVFPPGYLFSRAEGARLYRQAVPILRGDPRFLDDNSKIETNSRSVSFEWDETGALKSRPSQWPRPEIAVRLRRSADRLEQDLSRLLPEENGNFKLRAAMLRVSYDGMPRAHEIHIDELAYFTFNYALGADGSSIYLPKRGRVRVITAPEGRWSAVSGQEREELTGIPSALHSASRKLVDERFHIQYQFSVDDDAYWPKISKGRTPRQVDDFLDKMLNRNINRIFKVRELLAKPGQAAVTPAD